MTPEANRPLFFNLLWWGMGRVGKVNSVLDYAVMYQVLRFAAIILFLLVLPDLSAGF